MIFAQEFPFPAVLDSSMITAFKACPRQFWFAYVRRVVPAGLSVHLVAGHALAKALERARHLWYVEGCRDQAKVYAEAIRTLWLEYDPNTPVPDRNRAKGPLVLAEGLVRFLDHFNFAYDTVQPANIGRHAIEFTFAQDTDVAHPETGDPIQYCGRMDMIADTGEALFVEDDKTTGSYGPQWSDNWRMRYQFLGYCWAARENNIPVAGVIVRGLVLTLSKIEAVQDIKMYPEWKIARWHEQMQRDVQAIVRAWETDTWEYDLSQSCTSYGGCDYVDACDQPDHERGITDGLYQINTWTPLAQEEAA
jgi:hypothetical protein